jgi:hypothetical protein
MLGGADVDRVLSRRADELDAAVAEVQAGAYLLKFGRSGKPHKRYFRVNDDGDALFWLSRRKRLADTTVHLADVERLQRGQHTSVFARYAKEFAHVAPLSLSIVTAGGGVGAAGGGGSGMGMGASGSSSGVARTLDLVFDSPEQLDAWHTGLQALLIRNRLAVEDSDVKHLRRAFTQEVARGRSDAPAAVAAATAEAVAGGAGGGGGREACISYERVKAILRRLNIYKGKKVLRAMFAAVDVRGEGALSFEAFVRLIDLLRDRPDIATVYAAHAGAGRAAGQAERTANAAIDDSAGHVFGGSTGGLQQPVGAGTSFPAPTSNAASATSCPCACFGTSCARTRVRRR